MRHTGSMKYKFAGAASILTLASAMAASPVQAASTSSSVTDSFQHFIQCAEWLITNPAMHAKDCGPGHTVTVSSGGDGSAFVDTE